MSMAGGFTFRDMATSGSHIRKQPGPHIKQEDGFGSPTTAGRGSVTSLGAGHHITMAGGFITATTGAGGPDRSMFTTVRYGLRHSSFLSASDSTPASALAPLDGSPWVRMILFIPGTDAISTA